MNPPGSFDIRTQSWGNNLCGTFKKKSLEENQSREEEEVVEECHAAIGPPRSTEQIRYAWIPSTRGVAKPSWLSHITQASKTFLERTKVPQSKTQPIVQIPIEVSTHKISISFTSQQTKHETSETSISRTQVTRKSSTIFTFIQIPQTEQISNTRKSAQKHWKCR